MRFKPAGGFNRRSGRSGVKARLDVESVKTAQDEIFNTKQHENEIIRSENKAHGLSPNTDLESAKAQRLMNNEEAAGKVVKTSSNKIFDPKGKRDFKPVDLPEEPAKTVSEKINRTA